MTSKDFNPSKRTYDKGNYVDVLEILTPKIYFEEDYNMSGMRLNPISEVINSHLRICSGIGKVLFVSSLYYKT